MASLKTVHKAEFIFVKILIPFSIGIISVYQLKFPALLAGLLLLIVATFTYLFFLNLKYKQLKTDRKKGRITVLLYCLIGLIGSLCCTLYNTSIPTDYNYFKEKKYLKLTVINEPKIKQNIIWFDALATKILSPDSSATGKRIRDSRAISIKIRMALKLDVTSTISLKYGDELLIPARLSETAPTKNPGEFDYKSWLAAQRIYHQAFFRHNEVVKLQTKASNWLIGYALELREKEVAFYRKIIKDDEAFAVAATLILGYRSDLSADTLEIYSKTGTIHALSVSGMHVGLIYLVLNWLLQFLDRNRILKILKILLILILIWAYSLITGLSPSVVRSAIMISVFILEKLFSRTSNSYNTIAFAACCMLIYNPFLIWDVGFQLSFLAVFGLIYLQPKLYKWLAVNNIILDKIWSATTLSLAAQLSTYPLSIYYFHQFPVYFLLSNLFIILPVALIIYLGLLITIFKLNSLGPLFEWLLHFTNIGLSEISALPFSTISALWMSKPALICLSLALIAFILAFEHCSKQWLFISSIALLTLQCMLSYDKISAQHQKKYICFALRKNYAVAFIKGHHAILHTDVKCGSKIFNYSLKPTFDQLKVCRITFKE